MMGEYDDMFNRETGAECAARERLERLTAERDRYKRALEMIARGVTDPQGTALRSLMFKP